MEFSKRARFAGRGGGGHGFGHGFGHGRQSVATLHDDVDDGNNGHGNDHSGHDDSNPGHGGPNGDDRSRLKFADFHREPGESFDQFDVANDELVTNTTTSVPVYHIELNQFLGGAPVDGATIVVTVSEANEFLGIRSNFRPELVGGSANARTTTGEAISRALSFTNLTNENLDEMPAAFPAWVENEGLLHRAWRVALSPVSGAGLLVTILDDGEAVLEIEELGAGACPVITERIDNPTGQGTTELPVAIPVGFRDGLGYAYPIMPPLPGDPDANAFGFLDRVDDVPLREMCNWSGPRAEEHNGTPFGKYVRVAQHAGPLHQDLNYDLRSSFGISTVLRIDRNPTGTLTPNGAEISISNPGTGVDLEEVDDSERLLDETMAYFHIDQMARFFEERYGQTLSRAVNADPAITVHVNDTPPNGADNAWWDIRLDVESSIFATTERYRSKIQVGRGLFLRPVHDNFSLFGEPPSDLYAPVDWTRDGTVLAHEYTHATIWDVSRLRAGKKSRILGSDIFDPVKGLRSVYHEGMSDYFAGSALNRPVVLEWVTTPAGGRDLRTDPASPFLVENATGDPHVDGQILSQTFWELRTRLEQLKSEVPLATSGARRADRIAWGSVQRVGRSIRSYREPLDDSLATDSDVYEKLFHYEILAAFARHGIEQEDVVSIIQPGQFVVDGTTGAPNLVARGFLGQGVAYVVEFSSNPNAFGPLNPNQQPDRASPGFNYVRISSAAPGAPPIVQIPGSPVGENNIVDFEISNADLELLAAGSLNPIPVFMHLTVIGPDSSLAFSHIPGAGEVFANTDHPGTLYFPLASSGPGTCPLALILLASPMMAAVAAQSVVARTKRRRR